MITELPDNKSKQYGGAYSIHDNAVCTHRDSLIRNWPDVSINTDELKHKFFETYSTWFPKPHNFIGIADFTEMCYTHGTTESFSQFYIRYHDKRRLRIAHGDYFYHQMMHKLYWTERFAWLEDDEIRAGDVLVISTPFSDTGDIYPNLEQILTDCDRLGVPVMLDMAFVSTAAGLSLDLTHPCIEYIVTSLSKVFPLEEHRIGIRLQRPEQKYEDQLYVINEDNYNYINTLNCYVATEMMQKFEADYINAKYKILQKKYCEDLNLMPSPCVIFGIDHNKVYNQYNRGTATNRLCFSRTWDGRYDFRT